MKPRQEDVEISNTESDPLSDVVVEQVAQAIYEDKTLRRGYSPVPWGQQTEYTNDLYRSFARAAVSAFLKATGEQEPIALRDVTSADILSSRPVCVAPCDGSGGFPPKGDGIFGWMKCPGCEGCKPVPSSVQVPQDPAVELQRLRNAVGDVRGMQSDGASPEEMDAALGEALVPQDQPPTSVTVTFPRRHADILHGFLNDSGYGREHGYDDESVRFVEAAHDLLIGACEAAWPQDQPNQEEGR